MKIGPVESLDSSPLTDATKRIIGPAARSINTIQRTNQTRVLAAVPSYEVSTGRQVMQYVGEGAKDDFRHFWFGHRNITLWLRLAYDFLYNLRSFYSCNHCRVTGRQNHNPQQQQEQERRRLFIDCLF